MKTAGIMICLLVSSALAAQGVNQKLGTAISRLENDSQTKSAIVGLYVVNSKTGEVLINRNGNIGFAPASSQKVITSATAFEVLGSTFQYETQLAYSGSITGNVLNGNIYIIGSGDPTLGSWRYSSTKENTVLNKWVKAIQAAGIKKINGKVFVYDKDASKEMIPGGWTWDDMGNYYGAGATGLNWHENQYDLVLTSRTTGDTVTVTSTEPMLYNNAFINYITAGKPGTGDNAIIYRGPNAPTAILRGTISPNEKRFIIAGSMPQPSFQLSNIFSDVLQQQGLGENLAGNEFDKSEVVLPRSITSISIHQSPKLDSIIYWFLKKSINLYGEALIKTLGEKQPVKSTDEPGNGTQKGVQFIKGFWKDKGIDPSALNVLDGSGLSPQNRVTPETLVKVMAFAKTRSWYPAFYEGLPVINGLKMKSGSIGGARSYTGYSGDYIFAIIVNNYSGSGSEIQQKMWRVLDNLK
jgi:serine-type D-Ala-D-Ala carboxypeptidase/endopeptidase (penicillin-binding protein 4)